MTENTETKKEIKILAIESSCDETAAAVVVNGRDLRSNVISSQIALHTLYGGVVPEIASRKHIEKINQVIEQALSDAHMTLDDIDAIGVTYGPGLVGALLVGVAEAKAIAYARNIPLVGVHHIEGHISANYIENKDLEPPFLALVVSGGHTHLVRVVDYGKYEILGRTRDDAAGEAFDKVARAIGLGYPGGPKIEKVSHEGDPHSIEFPRAKIVGGVYDFSFSGLKSAVLNYLNGCRMKGLEINRADVAASFQQAVTDVLVGHAENAIDEFKMDKFAIAGGVASNGIIRHAMEEMCARKGVKFYRPSPILCTDNAAMIGAAAYYDFQLVSYMGYLMGCAGSFSENKCDAASAESCADEYIIMSNDTGYDPAVRFWKDKGFAVRRFNVNFCKQAVQRRKNIKYQVVADIPSKEDNANTNINTDTDTDTDTDAITAKSYNLNELIDGNHSSYTDRDRKSVV